MLTIHVRPKRLKEFLLTHPLYKSPFRTLSRLTTVMAFWKWSCYNKDK